MAKHETVIVDLGNSLLKAMKEGIPSSAIVVPHALKTLSEGKFNEIQGRMKRGYTRGIGTAHDTFSYDGKFYVTGEKAEQMGMDSRRSGGVKYLKDYYAPLLLTMLLRLYPNGHDGTLAVWVAFPPGDIRHVDTIQQSLGGKHTVTLDNNTSFTFRIKQVFTYDEPVGGLWNYLLEANGTHLRKNVASGYGLCIDIGGKISSLVPFFSDGRVSYERTHSIDLGIQDVMQQVSDVLLATPEYANEFRHVRGSLPFDEDMRHALETGQYPCGGKELNALDALADATMNISTQLKQIYQQQLGGARQYKFIVITGGGGGLLYDHLTQHVLDFPLDKVHRSADRENMHLANLLGGDKACAAMHAREKVKS